MIVIGQRWCAQVTVRLTGEDRCEDVACFSAGSSLPMPMVGEAIKIGGMTAQVVDVLHDYDADPVKVLILVK